MPESDTVYSKEDERNVAESLISLASGGNTEAVKALRRMRLDNLYSELLTNIDDDEFSPAPFED